MCIVSNITTETDSGNRETSLVNNLYGVLNSFGSFGNGKHTIFSVSNLLVITRPKDLSHTKVKFVLSRYIIPHMHCFTYLSENLSIRPIPECFIEIVVSHDSRVNYNLRVSLIELLTDLKH